MHRHKQDNPTPESPSLDDEDREAGLIKSAPPSTETNRKTSSCRKYFEKVDEYVTAGKKEIGQVYICILDQQNPKRRIKACGTTKPLWEFLKRNFRKEYNLETAAKNADGENEAIVTVEKYKFDDHSSWVRNCKLSKNAN